MNEFTVMMSLGKQDSIEWCEVLSWTEAERLKIDVRDDVGAMGHFNGVLFGDYLYKKIDALFVRKDFKQFDYLTVEPPTWAIITTFALTLLINIVLSFWIVKNEFTEED